MTGISDRDDYEKLQPNVIAESQEYVIRAPIRHKFRDSQENYVMR